MAISRYCLGPASGFSFSPLGFLQVGTDTDMSDNSLLKVTGSSWQLCFIPDCSAHFKNKYQSTDKFSDNMDKGEQCTAVGFQAL